MMRMILGLFTLISFLAGAKANYMDAQYGGISSANSEMIRNKINNMNSKIWGCEMDFLNDANGKNNVSLNCGTELIFHLVDSEENLGYGATNSLILNYLTLLNFELKSCFANPDKDYYGRTCYFQKLIR